MLSRRPLRIVVLLLAILTPEAMADPPVASYLFPAGGRRGTTVEVRVGGLNLHSKASFEMLGRGVRAPSTIERTDTLWLEGPLLPLPDSQQAEDYPKDYAARVTLDSDAPIGPRACRVWTSQGASGSLPFIVGDLPEVVEHEAEGDPVPEPVTLPVTINGRIFPYEDVDLWSFSLRKGEVFTAEVQAGRLGSPLDPWLEAFEPGGRQVAEAVPASSCDARLAFVAARDGTYRIKIHDVNVKGGQRFVYRLTLTTGPSIARVFPLGGRRGSSERFVLEGLGVPERSEPIKLPNEGAGRGPESTGVQFPFGGAATIELDDLTGALEAEPNDAPAKAAPLAVPGIGDGRIAQGGDVDLWKVSLEKDRSYQLDLRAARLGSQLDGLLSLTGPDGKEAARAEGTAAHGGDPSLVFRPPVSGDYLVRITDRFHSRGGSAWSYRLRVSDVPAADFRLALAADTLSVPRGGTAKLKVEAERRGGFKGPITLDVEGLPEGASFAKTIIGPDKMSADLAIKADTRAPIRSARLTVRGKAEVDGKPIARLAHRAGPPGFPEVDSVRLAIALPTPFRITGPIDFGSSPRGSVRHRRYRIARNGYNGAVEVRLADRQARHLQGVTGPVIVVPAGKEDVDYPITLPPWMEIGRTSRTVVMATGVVHEPDGTEHEVSFSTPGNELQIAAVIGPGRLGLEAQRSSFGFRPGGVIEVPVKVTRSPEVEGPVQVELARPKAVRGFSAKPLVLPAGQDEGVVRIVCGTADEDPPTEHMTLRAVATAEGGPVTAETKLTLVADD